jgi:hypothetical protein
MDSQNVYVPTSAVPTKEFVDLLIALVGVPGVYFFCQQDDTPLYVGVSISLGQRIIASYEERFGAKKNRQNEDILQSINFTTSDPVFLRHIQTASAADAFVCETIAIQRYKPLLNGTVAKDNLTLNLPELIFSTPILCNQPGVFNTSEVNQKNYAANMINLTHHLTWCRKEKKRQSAADALDQSFNRYVKTR